MTKTEDANFAWKEKKVNNLIHLMRSGKDTIYFNDDDVFGDSMFDAQSILRKKLKNIDDDINDIFCVDNYLYVWEGDHIALLTTKTKMKILVN